MGCFLEYLLGHDLFFISQVRKAVKEKDLKEIASDMICVLPSVREKWYITNVEEILATKRPTCYQQARTEDIYNFFEQDVKEWVPAGAKKKK